jgi:hypothetical protein
MTWARGSLIVLLAAIAAGALTLSASSTLQLASRSGVHNVQFASIAVLELAAIVGTVMWLRASHWRSRVEAALLVVGASAVTAIGGLGAYGLFGLVGPAFLVASVHVASREWRAEPHAAHEPSATAPVAPVEPWGPPETVPETAPVAPSPPATLHAVPGLARERSDGLDALSRDDLRELAKTRGVTQRGSADELRVRLRAATAPNREASA